MSTSPVIYVLVCTIDDGIQSVPQVLLPAEEGVTYVVSWQQSRPFGECPETLRRADVIVTSLGGRGLSRNRNHALQTAMSLLRDPLDDAVIVLADDDERLEADAFRKIRDLYGRYPKLDVALFRMTDRQDGRLLKHYPAAPVSYRQRPRNYYVSSVEMTFRSRLYWMGCRFDERFGLGSDKLSAGEEEIFLTDALRRGLCVWICPYVICSTDARTTGSRVLDVKLLRSKGAVYGYCHRAPWAFLRSAREAFSLSVRHRRSFFFIFQNIWYGVRYVKEIPGRPIPDRPTPAPFLEGGEKAGAQQSFFKPEGSPPSREGLEVGPQLTIVVPVHNREKLVSRTLDSIAASTSTAFRLVVVDNASTDSTFAVCRDWIDAHRRTGLDAVLLTESAPGAPAARNRGLAACETPWVYFFDSDDLFDARFVASFAAMPPTSDVDLYCFPTRQDVGGRLAVRAYTPTADAAVHVVSSMLNTQSMVFRTSWLRTLGGWDPHLDIWQDWELGLRALLARPRLQWYRDGAFHRIIIHPDSITGRNFTATMPAVASAMRAGLRDVLQAAALAPAERRRLCLAFYYRAHIMAGKFAKEGNPVGQSLMREIAGESLTSPSRTQQLAGRVLEAYTAHGGRGAWRLASWMLK